MERPKSDRAGNIVRQDTGYDAYIPKLLMPQGPSFERDSEYEHLLTEAHLKLGELKGISQVLPNPDLFVAFYVKKEALLSSQIEGTQSSIDEVLQVDPETQTMRPVDEVINYIKSMNAGLEKIKKLPFSTRLINQLHEVLMTDVRGREKNPGQYKTRQNWIGPSGCTLKEAVFIPPPPHMTQTLMSDLEKFYHEETKIPDLIKAAIIHYQFETIHPYADGNGRLGRLIVTLMLSEKEVIDRPLLYLSLFFKEHREEYYDLLMKVRFEGAWEKWFKFFLRGVRHTSAEAAKTAKDILKLLEADKLKISRHITKSKNLLAAYEKICTMPIFTIPSLEKDLGVTYPTAKLQVDALVKMGILKEIDEKERNKLYSYESYLEILRRGT